MLFEALTTRKTVTVGERLIVPYKLAEVRPEIFVYFNCKMSMLMTKYSVYTCFKLMHCIGDIPHFSI